MTIREALIKLGAEFLEVDCFTCKHRDGMPKLIHMKHNGYGTGHYPPRPERKEALQKARDHDTDGTHDIKIFIGRG